jgi:hypothetical protein
MEVQRVISMNDHPIIILTMSYDRAKIKKTEVIRRRKKILDPLVL